MGLGPLADFTIEEARERARKARQLLRDGIDPIEARRSERTKQQAEAAALAARSRTFKQCVDLYFDRQSVGWKNKTHRAQFHSTLTDYVYPTIGALPVADVTRDLVLRCVEPIWQTKNPTAARVLRRIRWVLDFAKVQGWRDGENPAAWAGNLQHALAKPGAVKKVQHHEAMPFSQIHEFVARLRERRGIAARALEFTILTAARTSEVTGARWSEIDLAAKTWTIPAHRMKAEKAHRVPLSDQAIAILRALSREGDFVFIGNRQDRALGEDSMLQVLRKRMKCNATVHGFRSTFRDWAAEKTSFANHVIEMALAHTISSAVERAYRRGDLFAQRKLLMKDWADFCETEQREATVTSIRKRV